MVVGWAYQLINLALGCLAGEWPHQLPCFSRQCNFYREECLAAGHSPCWNEGVVGGTIIIYTHFVLVPPF